MKIRKKIHITALFAVLFLFVLAGCDDAKDSDTKNGDTKDTVRNVEVSSLNIPPAAINLSVVASLETATDRDIRRDVETYSLTVNFEKGEITTEGSTLTSADITYAVAYLKKDDTKKRTATELVTDIVTNIRMIRPELDKDTNPATYVNRRDAVDGKYIWTYTLQDLLISLPAANATATIVGLKSDTEYEIIILATAIADGVVYTVPSKVITSEVITGKVVTSKVIPSKVIKPIVKLSPNIPPKATDLTVIATKENSSSGTGKVYNLTVTFTKGAITAKGSTLKPNEILYAVTYIKKDDAKDTPRTAAELVAAVTDKALDAIKNPTANIPATEIYDKKPFVLGNNIPNGLSVPLTANEISLYGLERNTEYEIIITASAMSDGIVYTSLSDVVTKTTLDVDSLNP